MYESTILDIQKNTTWSLGIRYSLNTYFYINLAKRTLQPANDSSQNQKDKFEIELRRSKKTRTSSSFNLDGYKTAFLNEDLDEFYME